MRKIIVKYGGNCRKCGAEIEEGSEAIHERRVGLFCLGCEPTDPEDIREYRQEAADRKADKYDEWAGKRETKAAADLNSMPEIRHDWAFITQPGHIPLRARMNRSDDRACESLQVDDGFRRKADSLRHVRVKGDAAARDAEIVVNVLSWIKVGMVVVDAHCGDCTVIKINKKTAKIRLHSTGSQFNKELIFISRIKETA